MNKNDKIASNLSEAIVAVLNGHTNVATKLVANALRDLTSNAVVTPEAKPTMSAARNLKKRASDKRGRGPALAGDRLTDFATRLQNGTSVPKLAKHFGISLPTVYKYADMVKKQAVATQATAEAVL